MQVKQQSNFHIIPFNYCANYAEFQTKLSEKSVWKSKNPVKEELNQHIKRKVPVLVLLDLNSTLLDTNRKQEGKELSYQYSLENDNKVYTR